MLATAWMPAGTKRYRVAIAGHTGRGNFGHDWDLTWNGFRNVEVVAASDPDPAGLARAVKRSGARKGYADYARMLREEKPDLVTISPRWASARVEMVEAAVVVAAVVAAAVADSSFMAGGFAYHFAYHGVASVHYGRA